MICRSRILLTFLLAVMLGLSAFSQTKRANHWLFQANVWLDFNTGSPPSATEQPHNHISFPITFSGISDTDGNLLFSATSSRVFDKDFWPMANGDIIGGSHIFQPPLIINKPGSERYYYIFNYSTTNGGYTDQLVYSLIDMEANGGYGEVVESEKMVTLGTNVVRNVNGIHHANGEDVWIVNHSVNNRKWNAYLVTSVGVNLSPQISTAGDVEKWTDAYIKISPDGKYIAHTLSNDLPYGNHEQTRIELLTFNTSTGIVSDSGRIIFNIDQPGNLNRTGFEFSPDGSKFYTSTYHRLYQYDLKAGDSLAIINSRYSYELDTVQLPYMLNYLLGSMQLGPDGKIYNNATEGTSFSQGAKYLSVINKPNEKGAASDFHQNFYYMNGCVSAFDYSLPNFLADYFKDPIIHADRNCANAPINFSLELYDVIDSVKWDFDDFWNMTGDTSTLMSPSYVYSHPGIYDVTATIYFGNLHKVLPKRIEVFPSPEPQLGGADTLMCQGSTIVLDPGVFVQYWWNGGMPSGQTYTVIDSGQYFVKVKNEFNCFGYDTINVHIPPPMVVVADPAIQDATCGNPDGSITGIQLTGLEPFTYLWKNTVGDTVGNAQDLTGVVAGTYTLMVIDSAGCSALIGNYEINNTQGVKILDVSHLDDHCNSSIGELTIVPDSGVPGDFEYSLDGTNFFSNNGVFSGLPADTYHPVIRDVNGCTDTWLEPVVIENITGPVVLSINIEPETELGADGSITITADGNNLTYMITGGTPQAEPTFRGLFQGPYTITITDSFGCTTDTTITIPYVEGYYLHAVADNDDKCLHIKASSPVKVVNGAGMTDLKATLYYDGNIVDCIGYGYKMDGLDAIVYPASSSIVLDLQGGFPIPVSDSVDLIELIFDTYQAGFSEITWEEDNQQTWFKSESGEDIKAILYPGRITVHDPPQLKTTEDLSRCAGDSLVINPALTGGTDPMQYTWNTPTGVIPGSRLTIPAIEETDAGAYILAVRDHFDCVDTSRFALTVIPAPETGFESMNDTIYFYKDYTLSAIDGYPSYEWNTGATTSSILVTDDGEYIVTVKTSENCENTGSIYMINSDPGFFMPTAFTPNGDGLNDEFKAVIDMERIRQFHLAIYNKWGQLLFESVDAKAGWNGSDALPGVYVWKADFKDLRGEVHSASGSVSLIR